MTTDTPSARRIIGLSVADDVSGLNLGAFYLACFVSIMLATFLPQSQPFLLIELLAVPDNQQGVVSGNLNFWGEIVIISTVGLFGAFSDKVGRRLVIAIGFTIMAVGFWLYPRATSVNELLMYRVIYSFGIAAVSVMIVTVVADYVRDKSRGVASGYLGMMNGLGAMTAALVLIKLPSWFIEDGMTPLDAAERTFGMVSGIALFTALVMWFGLRKDRRKADDERSGLITMLAEGVAAARDPGVALAYGASFVARGNLAVVGTFASLWFTAYGVNELGMSPADAQAKGGTILAISYSAALFGAPIFGIMTDKISRTHALMITLGITFVGYGGTFFVTDPFGVLMLVLMIAIGLSEVGCIITSGVLIAQQSPERIRGSAIGVFNLTGAVGILVASKVGGHLYDSWRAAGPFVFFGIVALLVLLWALLVQRRVTPVDVTAGSDHALAEQAQESTGYS